MARALCLVAFATDVWSFRVVKRQAALVKRQAGALCEELVVRNTCRTLGGDDTRATSSSIGEALGISNNDATSFLVQLGMGDDVTVECEALCESTLKSLGEDRLPPKQDVGCYMMGSKKVCDADLSDETLAAMAHKSSTNRHRRRNEPPVMRQQLSSEEQRDMEIALENLKEVTDFDDLLVMLANYFHVYPMTGGDLDGDSTSFVEGSSGGFGGSSDQKKIDAQTKADLSKTLQLLNQGKADTKLAKWFGGTDSRTRKIVKEGVQHIANVMKSPHYINWPDEKGYWGWVYSPYKQSRNGTWSIHLGGEYFTADAADKIGTLTHEASHFYPLGTDDHVYCGVDKCLRKAKNKPDKALTNADHFSFFIDDVVEGGMR